MSNGVVSSYSYDNGDRLTLITHKTGGTTLTGFRYVYDNAGNRTNEFDFSNSNTITWGYDNAYQLTSETRVNNSGVLQYANTITYDAAGNRTLLQDGSNRTTYTYDAANQLTTTLLGSTRTTYTYDAKGNLQVEHVGTTRTTNTWDEENRLIQVAKTGATTNTYTFNGDGQRVQIVDSQGTKKPIWDLSNVLLEQDSLNATQVVYTLEPAIYGNLLSQRRGVTTSYYLFDALGSTRMLTSSAGASTDTYNFKAFGETWNSTGSTTNVFRWVGRLGYYYDIDRLAYYLRARPYSPKLARFLSYDPIGVAGGLNLFGYVNNRMVRLVDPSGKAVKDPCRDQGIACRQAAQDEYDACMRDVQKWIEQGNEEDEDHNEHDCVAQRAVRGERCNQAEADCYERHRKFRNSWKYHVWRCFIHIFVD